jgi:hypothetical protein
MGAGCCGGEKLDPEPPVYQPVVRSKTPIIHTPITYEEPKTPSPRPSREYSPKQSFTNIGLSTSNPLRLIEGYEREPLVSLEEALKPFYDNIDRLSDYIKQAKTKCHYPSEHNLTRDESAAIYIYTMRWGEGCLYDRLLAAWASEKPSELKPWLKYFKLFRTALNKLPDAKTEIWQGKAFDEDLEKKLSSNSLPFYSSMSSCLQSQAEVKEYLERYGDEKIMIVGYKSAEGKVVTGYTADSRSNEIMLWAGTKLGVSNYEVFDSNGSVIFHLTGPPSKYHFIQASSLPQLAY